MSGLDLTLSATNNLSNNGTIISAGALTLSAASGALSNTGHVQAVHDVNLVTAGDLTNSGLIASKSGSINLNTAGTAGNITVNGTGGTLQALNGDINIRNAAYVGAANVDLTGGDYLSKNLNIYSDQGSITGNVGNVTGVINSQAQTEHISAAAKTLTLGDNTIAGDPTYVNTAGDIHISGTLNPGGPLAILASGSIVADKTGAILNSGSDVTLVAGANVSTINVDPSAPKQSGTLTAISAGDAASIPGVNGGSTTGGSIDFRGSTSAIGIDTSINTTNINTNGGNVQP